MNTVGESSGSSDQTAAVVVPMAVVRTLYSSERQAAEYDILVATAVECLAARGRTAGELYGDIQRVWPGTKVLETSVIAALAAAETANLVHVSGDIYRLSEMGMAEVDKSRLWAEDVYRHTADALREKAEHGLRPISDDEARLWVGLISFALLGAIASATTAYRGDVNLQGDSLVLPRSFDADELSRSLDKAHVGGDVRAFLDAMLLEAIDPSVPFGKELVSSITTGYLLQAFLARRDAISARRAVGSLAGQVAILDTPILFQLLDPAPNGSPFFTAIRVAMRSGIDIVVCRHSLQELGGVLKRVERENAVAIERATRTKGTASLFRRLVAEPVIELYLAGYGEGVFDNWTQFRDYFFGLSGRLQHEGVRVIDHGNGPLDHVDELYSRLSSTIAERPPVQGRQVGRGVEETRRDAETMGLAWRLRRERSRPGSMWPAAWVVTTDTAMAVAYRRVNKKDRETLTISPSQWVSVVSAFAAPADIEQLAQSGAVMLAQETMLRVAARYPASAVVEIAEALAETSTDTDVRVAQLSLDDLMKDLPEIAADARRLGVALASKVLAKRSQRMDQVQAVYTSALHHERKALEDTRDRSADEVAKERAGRMAAEAERDALLASQAAERQQRANAVTSARRRTVQLIGTVAVFAGAIVSATIWQTTDAWDSLAGPAALALALSATTFYLTAEQWVDDLTLGRRRLFVALVPQLIAIPGLLDSIGIKLPWQ